MVTNIHEQVMSQTEKKDSIIKYKFLYTAMIVLVYLLGRCIPLYGIENVSRMDGTMDAGMLLEQTVSGDLNGQSLFTLGIAPYITASILVQITASIFRGGTRNKISPGKMNRITVILTLLFALFQAAVHVQELEYRVTGTQIVLAQTAGVVEMITGAALILWLAERNKKYGFGGQSVLIYINIIDGMIRTLSRYPWEELLLPVMISLAVMVIILLMESTEKRIPVQRISIHNVYADKNYLAIKLNTAGVMPVMFATAVFMLPQLLVTALSYLLPGNEDMIWWKENLALDRPLGIGIYILILYLLTVGFAMIMINPGDIAEQFLKGGDSIPGFHAGRDTKWYLTRQICRISFFGATIMSICLGVPMCLQLKGSMESDLVMFPASIMMLTSLWYNLYQEFLAVRSFDAYRPFI